MPATARITSQNRWIKTKTPHLRRKRPKMRHFIFYTEIGTIKAGSARCRFPPECGSVARPCFVPARRYSRLLIRNCSQQLRPAYEDGRTTAFSQTYPIHAQRNRRAPALKFRSSLFKGLRVKGRALVARRNGRNSPAFCFGKKEAWRKSPFLKGATFSILNRIREADTSLRTYKRTFIRHSNATCILTCKIGTQTRHASRHPNTTCKTRKSHPSAPTAKRIIRIARIPNPTQAKTAANTNFRCFCLSIFPVSCFILTWQVTE